MEVLKQWAVQRRAGLSEPRGLQKPLRLSLHTEAKLHGGGLTFVTPDAFETCDASAGFVVLFPDQLPSALGRNGPAALHPLRGQSRKPVQKRLRISSAQGAPTQMNGSADHTIAAGHHGTATGWRLACRTEQKVLKPPPHGASGGELTGLQHHLHIPGEQQATGDPSERAAPFDRDRDQKLANQRLPPFLQLTLSSSAPEPPGAHLGARLKSQPGARPADRVDGLIQQPSLKALQFQGIQIGHRINPFTGTQPALPKPGGLRTLQPAQQSIGIDGTGSVVSRGWERAHHQHGPGQTGQGLRSLLIQPAPGLQLTAIATERLFRIEIATGEGIGCWRQQETFRAGTLIAELLLKLRQPLLYRRCRRLILSGALAVHTS